MLHDVSPDVVAPSGPAPANEDRADDTAVLQKGDDGRARCWWSLSAPEYVAYHDHEWGRPVLDDDGIYERLCLEGFQSGLSWLTILRKREAFRAAFVGFSIAKVAAFGPADVERLLGDAGIVRNRQKIEAAIGNARAALAVIEQRGSLAALFWAFRPDPPPGPPRSLADLPAETPESRALARELKRLGFRFVGPTTAYAHMQATGIVNDHVAGCWMRDEVEREQAAVGEIR
jgi:DNA-3-methyladenine glycosylase I